jgi:hypothetical protein
VVLVMIDSCLKTSLLPEGLCCVANRRTVFVVSRP